MEIREIIATNLTNLRKANKWTQAEFAEKLNYSDKAVSKWERGESLPDAEILKQISDIYGIRIDYLFEEHETDDVKDFLLPHQIKVNRIVITLLIIAVIWLIATLVFVYRFETPEIWKVFIWAIPASFLIGFMSIRRLKNSRLLEIIFLSIVLWTTLVAFYIQFITDVNFVLFIIGIPLQVVIVLACQLRYGRNIIKQNIKK